MDISDTRDGRRDCGLCQQPRQRDLPWIRIMLFRLLVERSEDPKPARVQIFLYLRCAAAISKVFLGTIFAGQKPAGQRKIRDYTNSVLAADGFKSTLKFCALIQVIVRLHTL